MELVMPDSNRKLIVIGLFILMLASVPLFLIALGLGWVWRGMAAVHHKLTFSPRAPTVP